MRWIVDRHTVPQELREMLAALAEEYPIVFEAGRGGRNARHVSLQPGAAEGSLTVTVTGRHATIHYDRPAQAARGLGALLAGLVKPGVPYHEQTSFTTVGIMLDCSRNAVMKVTHFQRWLRQLALLGYNTALLYTEDTYELPGEEYFGYLRGRYTADELRTIDRYAARLGIEMIGCIQTLGHLEQMLKWPAYAELKDTPSVLLVGQKKTEALLEKMIAQYARVYGSRRIHIGMDETHDLGRGRYLDRFGYRRGYDLFNQHLARVCAICRRHGLQPMIWSDMYFRMGSKTQDYYDKASRIPADVKRQIPSDVQLVYWDYYHRDQAFYRDWINRHRALGHEPVMASGVWTWGLYWYGRAVTEATVAPCVAACRAAGLREILFTLWGDDGAGCEFDSALAGLAYAAELMYAGDKPSHQRLAARFAAVCGADYDVVVGASAINDPSASVVNDRSASAINHPRINYPTRPEMTLFWDDPLLRIAWKNTRLGGRDVWKKAALHYAGIVRRLRPHQHTTAPVDLAHAYNLARFFHTKICFNLQLDAAYAGRHRRRLAAVRAQIRPLLGVLDELHESYRRQWHRRNQPFGFETIQGRLGGQRQRWGELARRLDELATGQTASIPELDECPTTPGFVDARWRSVAGAGML